MTAPSPSRSDTAALLAELERHLLARQALVARLGSVPELVLRAALVPSDEALRSLLDRLGERYPPAGTASHTDEEA